MLNIFISIIPIFMLIVTGYIIKLYFIKDTDFWDKIEHLVYYFLLPILLVKSIINAKLDSVNILDYIIVLLLPTLLVAIILVTLKKYTKFKNRDFTSIFQGSIRYNSYVLLSVLLILLPNNGMLYFGIITIVMIITTNLLSVFILSIYSEGKYDIDWKKVIKKIIYNPLIFSSVIGLLLNLVGFKLPNILQTYFTYISSAALTLSLLAVGAGLKLNTVNSDKVYIFIPVVIKLLILPLLYYFAVSMIYLDNSSKISILIYASVPTAGNAYILAKQMGGNHSLMASIVTFTMLISIITIPLVLYISS